MGVMEHINIRSSQIGVEKKENCKFTTLQVLNLLMLFPFFVVKDALLMNMRPNSSYEFSRHACLRCISIINNQTNRLVMMNGCAA